MVAYIFLAIIGFDLGHTAIGVLSIIMASFKLIEFAEKVSKS